jgi:hypothetical protein
MTIAMSSVSHGGSRAAITNPTIIARMSLTEFTTLSP